MSDELKEMKIIKSGSSWMITLSDFQDVQHSPYVWRNDIGKNDSLDQLYESLCNTREQSHEWIKNEINVLRAERDQAITRAGVWFDALQLCCQDMYATNIPELNMRAEMAESERDRAVQMVAKLIEAGNAMAGAFRLIAKLNSMGYSGPMYVWHALVDEWKEQK